MRRYAKTHLFLLSTSIIASAQPPSFSPTDVIGIERFPGSPIDRVRLLTDGFCVIDGADEHAPPLRRLYSAYVDSPLPMFVTTDLLLDAYVALLGEAVHSIEREQQELLVQFSERLLALGHADGSVAGSHLASLAEIALTFQDRSPEPPSREASAALATLTAQGASWRFPGIEPMFASYLEVEGDYGATPERTRTFRTRRFCQAVRFRTGETAGREQLEVLRRFLNDEELRRLWNALREPWAALVGPPHPMDVLEWSSSARDVDHVPLLPPCRTPWSELVDHLGARPRTGRWITAYGPMASEAGLELLESVRTPADVRIEDLTRPLIFDTLHGRFLSLLAGLQAPSEGAPALFSSSAWRRKQVRTQLGAWAASRHVFTLHANTTYFLGELEEPPSARVTPYPHVFDQLAKLAVELARLHEEFTRAHVDWRTVQDEIRPFGDPAHWRSRKGTRAERVRREQIWIRLMDPEIEESNETLAARVRAACEAPFEELAPEARTLLTSYRFDPIESPLRDLAHLARSLATIARKQLAVQALSEEERELLANIGPRIATLHGVLGNAFTHPPDDHPRIVPLELGPPNANDLLHVGLARPEFLYVILEHEGRPTLYRGSVFAYREFRGSKTYDEAWRARQPRR
ncbi:MAG: DUF3160 domain-containing protein [Planctomycetes bacterium]|nr:DUF3160 domain-containing protein [Planctomycetota bacterium]